jgi:AcrR family transcriptional regulator
MFNISESHIDVTDTKTKILAVANELFARQGFDGVSIRDIAQTAEVNVASINYHFKNKLNLLHQIFEYNYRWMESEVKKLSQQDGMKTPEMAFKIFLLFKNNGTACINSFQMILSDHLCPEDDNLNTGDEPFGPPGGKALLEVITKDVGEKVPQEDREWAMRMLFANILHFATIMNTNYIVKKCGDEKWMDTKQKEKEFKKLANSVINTLKA